MRPLVIATGPRSNGTSLLYRILCTGDTFPLHIPAYPPWFRGRDWAQDFPTALFVVIWRESQYAVRSLIERGLVEMLDDARVEQAEARSYLDRLPDDRTCDVSYDQLVAAPGATVAAITDFLRDYGYDGPALTLSEPVRDENAKWQEKAA